MVFMASGASALTLHVVGGELLGARDVEVNGALYDVEFLDGTCADVFAGCTHVFFFAFNSTLEAIDASGVLADQIFLDGVSGVFDSNPALIHGCEDSAMCRVHTPHAILSTGAIATVSVGNSNTEESDIRALTTTIYGWDDMSSPAKTWAVWWPVPEPGSDVLATAALMTLGLLAMGKRTRREV